jgi:hypothetical protein
MAKAEVMQGLPIFYLNDAKESKEEDGEGGGETGTANLYLSDTKESKEKIGEDEGDAGIANLIPN